VSTNTTTTTINSFLKNVKNVNTPSGGGGSNNNNNNIGGINQQSSHYQYQQQQQQQQQQLQYHSSNNQNNSQNAVEPVASSDLHYCPVTQFIGDMLRLLTCQNEKFGYQIQRHVQDLLGHELNTQCYPILFEQIKLVVEKFFDSQGQVCVSDQNTLFVENVIFIMRCVLESKNESVSGENPLSTVSVETLMINIVKYVRHLDSSVQIIQIKTKVCQLAEAVMRRREDLLFRQEMKFRNKLVEYLTDWIMGNSHQFNVTQSNNELTSTLNRDLDQASMEAVATLLTGLPLQPEENDKVLFWKNELMRRVGHKE
jgi:neurofibromin 1